MLISPGFVKLRATDDSLGHAIMYDPVKASDVENGANGSLGLRLPGPSAAGITPAASQREYDARRAKALQLLDDNINSLLSAGPKKQSHSKGASEFSWDSAQSKNGTAHDDVGVELVIQEKDL